MIYIVGALILGIVFYIFRMLGAYDILIPFEILFLIPFSFYIASHIVKIIRLREVQDETNRRTPAISGIHLFSEGLAHTVFFFLKDIYALAFSFFAIKNRLSFTTKFLVLRSIDISFYLLLAFLVNNIAHPFINIVRFDLFIYLMSLCFILFFLRKNIEGIEFNRVFLFSGLSWALEIIAFYSFLMITAKNKNTTWVDAITSYFTNYSILIDPYAKWFSLVILIISIPTLFILGKRKL